MDASDDDQTIRRLAQQIKHYLIAFFGKSIEEATDDEFYRVLTWVIREEIMIHWTATSHTHQCQKKKRVYYISLEWLPGRLFMNNMNNIAATDLVIKLLGFMKRDIRKTIYAEYEPGLGNGGLGRLAACFLDSLATHHYPAMGYGLRYQYGIFSQELWYGVQVERPDYWLLDEFPWEMRRDSFASNVFFEGTISPIRNKNDEEVYNLSNYEEVRALCYDVPAVGYGGKNPFPTLTLRLWTTKESPRNFELAKFNAGDLSDAIKNTAITDVLYPNDKHSLGLSMRIKQEYLLVCASLQDIFRQYFLMYENLDHFAELIRIQINDTHPALLVAELMRLLTQEYEVPWNQAWEITNQVCSYTNHTVLKESLEEWDCDLIKRILPRQYQIIEKINFDFCNQVRQRFPNDEDKVQRMSIIENDRVHMAHLAIVGSHKVNGVAALHSEILKTNIFKDFSDFYPDKFINVTNGVTQRRWLMTCNSKLSYFITELIGDTWIKDLKHLENLHQYATDKQVQERFLQIKKENKDRLLEVLCSLHKDRYGDDVDLNKAFFLQDDAIFDVQVKRIHEYKRQLMKALHTMMLYRSIQKNPDAYSVKRKVILGGKAAPGYETAKNIIRLFYLLARKINHDPVVGEKLKVVYIENYNVSKAELIMPAADLSNQISLAGQEASGTGNMKFALNGALTIGTEDGANIEMRQAVGDQYWPFRFGMTAQEVSELRQSKTYNPKELIEEDLEIKEVLDLLINKELTENEAEEKVLHTLYDNLLNGTNPDRYFVLKDLRSYNDIQKRVEDLYKDRNRWAEFCLHNMASMGSFSSDESIKNYAGKIWNIEGCPIDQAELERIRSEFSMTNGYCSMQ